MRITPKIYLRCQSKTVKYQSSIRERASSTELVILRIFLAIDAMELAILVWNGASELTGLAGTGTQGRHTGSILVIKAFTLFSSWSHFKARADKADAISGCRLDTWLSCEAPIPCIFGS